MVNDTSPWPAGPSDASLGPGGPSEWAMQLVRTTLEIKPYEGAKYGRLCICGDHAMCSMHEDMANELDKAKEEGLRIGLTQGLTDWKLHACEILAATKEGYEAGQLAKQTEVLEKGEL